MRVCAVIGADELREAWRIFTPLLDQIDNEAPQPVVHEFQTVVPDGVVELASAAGMTFNAMVRALLSGRPIAVRSQKSGLCLLRRTPRWRARSFGNASPRRHRRWVSCCVSMQCFRVAST